MNIQTVQGRNCRGNEIFYLQSNDFSTRCLIPTIYLHTLFSVGTSAGFTEASNRTFDKNPLYIKSKGVSSETFSIKHTAATIKYDTIEFVPKNKLR